MKTPNSTELIKVGALTLGGHTGLLWGPIINPIDGWVRKTGMVITHLWDIDAEQAEDFAEKHSAEIVKDYGDMVGKVDGVILSDFDAVPVFKHLARPYLEAGMPIFINRPFAFNLNDAREMLDLARQNSTPLMCGSSFEYVKEVEIIRNKVKSGGQITGYLVDNSMSDYATHGVHGLYFAYACVGGGVSRVAYLTPDWKNPNGVVVIEHLGRDGGKPFYGCIQEISGAGTNAWIKIYGQGFIEQFVWWEASAWDRDVFLWLPMLLKMQEMFQTHKMPETYDNIYEKTQIFLAGFKSHVEHNGAPVALSEIGDWTAPTLEPSQYESLF
ncbi:TPA: Gfo/Idh/MocA family oxidoreductase [Candidatus Poribacteria bacterium]|nr:Gfo/Idh/MocA family oxidoreductase [Candidatus Poribacteria bacterium]